jgi:methylated-DNA-[protein]-cysteine S-methyltransferase
MRLYRSTIPSPVGDLTLVASDAGLRAVMFHADENVDRVRIGRDGTDVVDDPDHPVIHQAATELAEYFAGDRTDFDVAVDAVGTEFQRTAWTALRAIPFGATASYAQQARRIGKPSAVRAVGAANGRNPVAIIVPCHRVVGSNGALVGFGGGVDRKAWLLDHERAVLARS